MSGGQVYRDAADGKGEAAVFDGGAYPFPGLVNRRVGQPHHREGGQAAGQVTLHRYRVARDAVQAQGGNAANHKISSFFQLKIPVTYGSKGGASQNFGCFFLSIVIFCKKYCNTNGYLCQKNKEKTPWMNLQMKQKVIN